MSYFKLYSIVHLTWSNQRILQKGKRKNLNKHTHSLWVSPLFFWDLTSGCYYCLLFSSVFLSISIYSQYLHISAVFILSMLPIAPWKTKISPGASICRAHKFFFQHQSTVQAVCQPCVLGTLFQSWVSAKRQLQALLLTLDYSQCC